jgi:hypothetical protein
VCFEHSHRVPGSEFGEIEDLAITLAAVPYPSIAVHRSPRHVAVSGDVNLIEDLQRGSHDAEYINDGVIVSAISS